MYESSASSNHYGAGMGMMKDSSHNNREDICCRLFIGGLSPSVTTESLRQYFSRFGSVVHCNVPKDPKTNRSRGYGFLTYKDKEHVDVAQNSRPHVLDGRQVETKRAMPREEANNPEAHVTTKKLFVGALRKDVTDDLLRDYFSSYGSIVDAYVVKDNATGESRGFGFVVFDDYDPVDKVMLYKPHLIRTGNSISITDVKKGLTKEELASAQLREQTKGGEGGGRGGGGGPPPSMGPGGPPQPPHPMMMGHWGPMGPMMGPGPGPMPPQPSQQQQHHHQQGGGGGSKHSHNQGKQLSNSNKSAKGGGSGGGGMGGGPGMGPYGPMGMMGMMGPGPMGPMGMMGPGPMGPMGMMGPGPMGPMGMMGPGPMGPMGMMGPGPMGPMGMMGPGFGFYPNQCGGYGPMGRGGWGGFRSSPYSMMPPHRTRSNST